jgi:hypothetical protein
MSRHGMQRVTGLLCAAMLSFAAIAPSVYGQTRIIPALSIAERYDTNVYFIGTGQQLEDFVTTVAPQLKMSHEGRLITGTAHVTVTGEAFMRNPGLNYVATNFAVSAVLDRLTGMVDKRWKMAVDNYFTYTPQPPAFFAPLPAGAGPGSAVAPTAPENFIRGIQAVRANSLINVFGVTSGYELSPMTSLAGSIRHQYMRFGTAFAPTPGQGFFTTTFTNLTAGPRFRISPRDTVSGNAQYSRMSFSQGDAFSSSFTLMGGTAGWERTWNPKLSTSFTGGATVFTGSSSLQYLASGSVTWSERNTNFILGYSRSIFPSFFAGAVPLLSQVVTGTVFHRFTERLSASGSLNYAKNEGALEATAIQFDSYGGSATLNYAISRTWFVSASYGHTIIKNVFAGQNFGFNRDVVSITLSKEWPDFFQPK